MPVKLLRRNYNAGYLGGAGNGGLVRHAGNMGLLKRNKVGYEIHFSGLSSAFSLPSLKVSAVPNVQEQCVDLQISFESWSAAGTLASNPIEGVGIYANGDCAGVSEFSQGGRDLLSWSAASSVVGPYSAVTTTRSASAAFHAVVGEYTHGLHMPYWGAAPAANPYPWFNDCVGEGQWFIPFRGGLTSTATVEVKPGQMTGYWRLLDPDGRVIRHKYPSTAHDHWGAEWSCAVEGFMVSGRVHRLVRWTGGQVSFTQSRLPGDYGEGAGFTTTAGTGIFFPAQQEAAEALLPAVKAVSATAWTRNVPL